MSRATTKATIAAIKLLVFILRIYGNIQFVARREAINRKALAQRLHVLLHVLFDTAASSPYFLAEEFNKPMIRVKRACDPVEETDGARFLVDHLWPQHSLVAA
jgi:hypothetical protein